MSRNPYNSDPMRAFDEIEADALALDDMARRLDESADVISKMPDGSQDAAQASRFKAKRLRRVAAFLGFMSGRMDRIHYLTEPQKRPNSYGGSTQREATS